MTLHELLIQGCYTTIKWINKTYYFVKSINPKLAEVKKMTKKIEADGENKDLFIILNGPSLKTQDLSLLKGKNLMFVNRGFMHPLYKELQPKYHVFIDSKMRDGVWPTQWIDDIIADNPSIRIILPYTWYSHPRFENYKKCPNIYWQTWTIPFYGIGVSAACFSYAIKNKFENIFFTGFDANGLAYDMIHQADSHFYGNDEELANMTTKQFALALFFHSQHLFNLNKFADYCKKKGIRIYNLTNGGLLDMFPRRRFNHPYADSE